MFLRQQQSLRKVWVTLLGFLILLFQKQLSLGHKQLSGPLPELLAGLTGRPSPGNGLGKALTHALCTQQGVLCCQSPDSGQGQEFGTLRHKPETPAQSTEDSDPVSEPDTYHTSRVLPDPSRSELESASLQASLEDKHSEKARKQRKLQEGERLGRLPAPRGDKVGLWTLPLLHQQVLQRESRTRALPVTTDSGVRRDRGRERSHETHRPPGTGHRRNHTLVLPPCPLGKRPDSAGALRGGRVHTGGRLQCE